MQATATSPQCCVSRRPCVGCRRPRDAPGQASSSARILHTGWGSSQCGSYLTERIAVHEDKLSIAIGPWTYRAMVEGGPEQTLESASRRVLSMVIRRHIIITFISGGEQQP